MYAFPFSLTVDLTARDDAIPKEFQCSKNQRWGSRARKQWCQIQSEDQKICTLLPSWCNARQKSHIPYYSISLYRCHFKSFSHGYSTQTMSVQSNGQYMRSTRTVRTHKDCVRARVIFLLSECACALSVANVLHVLCLQSVVFIRKI